MSGNRGNRGPGRPKGSVNKVTAAVRDATLEALDRLGGVDYLVQLGEDEPNVFGGLLKRCMPQQHEAKIETSSVVEVIDLSDAPRELAPNTPKSPPEDE